ncbi:hypothetical protein [Azospirillum soli]|uniref:hypothetical protein n=1 Tax=Azospirillum soli TaxID=1304799 RepID=UPI001AE6A72D|nr:hypothetical protein [Azospirillum soli]MBP2311892.1 hypothetical protein [Azospirillum soli]
MGLLDQTIDYAVPRSGDSSTQADGTPARTYQPFTGDPYRYGFGGEHQFFANNGLGAIAPQRAAAPAADPLADLYNVLRQAYRGYIDNGSGGAGLGLADPTASSFGGFANATLGGLASTFGGPLGLVGIGLGIANNSPSLGLASNINGLFGLNGLLDGVFGGGDGGSGGFGGTHGDAGIGDAGIGGGSDFG